MKFSVLQSFIFMIDSPEEIISSPPTTDISLSSGPCISSEVDASFAIRYIEPCQQKSIGAARIIPMP